MVKKYHFIDIETSASFQLLDCTTGICCSQTLNTYKSNMATAFIGNDILDIGSRKARRQRGDPMAPGLLTMGAPGQFDLPNVPDVS